LKFGEGGDSGGHLTDAVFQTSGSDRGHQLTGAVCRPIPGRLHSAGSVYAETETGAFVHGMLIRSSNSLTARFVQFSSTHQPDRTLVVASGSEGTEDPHQRCQIQEGESPLSV
jgi:hypothetical protein